MPDSTLHGKGCSAACAEQSQPGPTGSVETGLKVASLVAFAEPARREGPSWVRQAGGDETRSGSWRDVDGWQEFLADAPWVGVGRVKGPRAVC